MENKKTKSEFCRSFEWKIDIKWLDLTGMSPIDPGRHARIEMSDRYNDETYDSFVVSIINKATGLIDKKRFLFNDYLEADSDSDADATREPEFSANKWSGWGWHKYVPKSTRPICAAIENYIATFR